MFSFLTFSAVTGRRRPVLGVLPFFVSALLAACKEDDAAPKVELEDFCFEFAMAACEGTEACCADTGVSTGQFCLDSAFASCEARLLTEEERGETSTDVHIVFDFDEEGAGALIERVRSAFGRCEGEINPTFDDTHRLSELDGVCLEDTDCVATLACLRIGSSDSGGRCVAGPEEGEECSARCASPDNVCRYRPGEQTTVCTPFIEEGENCSAFDSHACSDGLYCKSCGDECSATCEPFLRIGAECTGSSEACGPDAYCSRVDEQDDASLWVCEADEEPLDSLCLFVSELALGF